MSQPPAGTLPQRVRIIGGLFRGRIVRFPPVAALRPTPDRVRETLFNWLGQNLTDLATLDLFTGSGALSLEAASRGATLCVAIDVNATLIAALAETALAFGATGIETRVGDARRFLARDTRHYDVIFLDPPFASDEWSWLLPACAARLTLGGFVYAEAAAQLIPPPALSQWRHAKAGQVHYHLFARA